ncbi:unnamed protein product, partial [Enterobius vermicularis]|uniref:Sortilin_C domain-containing protein n=1 Tax=Enterobius vermicularis TaxID=51028 RepID=A0A0N4VQF1_ENTVE
CLPWQFDCQFGNPRCIPQYKVNDGVIDCYTGFDEVKFNSLINVYGIYTNHYYQLYVYGCPPHYFVCHDRSACIDFGKYQDGKPHCRDKSDEHTAAAAAAHIGSNSNDRTCQAGYFLCNDRTKCIEGSKFQNGVEDCKDGSDEEGDQRNKNEDKEKNKLEIRDDNKFLKNLKGLIFNVKKKKSIKMALMHRCQVSTIVGLRRT